MQQEGDCIRVLLVEDHDTLGKALTFAFSFEEGIEIVGLAPTVSRALEMVATSQPDVVLMDVRLPDGSGIEATSRVMETRPETSVIVLTAHADPTYALRAAEAGAAGFALKDVRIANVVACVRQSVAGELAINETLLQSLLTQAAAEGCGRSGAPGLCPELPPAERVVVGLMAEGLGWQGIAARLGIPVAEAAGLMASAVSRLGARSHLEAVMLAARAGLLKPTPA